MDYFSVATLGAFPAPTPTDSQRAAYFSSWGLLDTAPALIVSAGRRPKWLTFYRRYRR